MTLKKGPVMVETRFAVRWMAFSLAVMVVSAAMLQRAAAGQEHTASKTPAVQNMGEVLVVGNKIEDFIKQNPSQVVTMGAAEIETRNFLQVQDVLGAMAGVDVKPSSGGLGTRIMIRGGGGSGSVLVLIDGRPAASMQFGGVDLSSIPIDIIKKITVFKPPVPVWLGPDSAAGAIYIETKSKKTKVKSGKKGKIRITGGSYGLAAMSATSQIDTRDSQYLLSGGLSRKDGKQPNSDRDQGHLSFGYDRKKEGRELQVNAKAYMSEHGIAGPTYNRTPDARQRYEKASLDMKYKGFTSSTDYTLKAWTDVKRLDETAQSGQDSTLDTLTAGMGTDVFVTGSDEKNELRFGGQAEHNRVDHTLSGKHDRTRVSGHTEYNLRIRPWIYTIGARADYTNDFDLSPGGHAGVSYSLSEATQIKANAGYTEHIPSFGQLYQPSHGAVDQVRGNPGLDKERIVSLSLGLDHTFMDDHKLSLALFRTDSRDLIKYQRNSSNISVPLNIDRAYKQGIETSFKFNFSQQTGIEFNYILQDTHNKSNDKALSYAPTHSGKLIFKTVFSSRTRFEWITRGYSKQYSDTDNTEAERIDPYLTTDVKVSQPVTLFKKKTLVFASLHNLFDKDYDVHYGYPDDGIKVEVGMSINF